MDTEFIDTPCVGMAGYSWGVDVDSKLLDRINMTSFVLVKRSFLHCVSLPCFNHALAI